MSDFPRRCACCNKKSITEPHGICPICGWEDDSVQSRDPDFAGGANSRSLRDYQTEYYRQKCENYELRQAGEEGLAQIEELIVRRIDWMNKVGIRQWNATDYMGYYPPEHYRHYMELGNLYTLISKADGTCVAAAVLMEEDDRWEGQRPENAYYVHHLATDERVPGMGRVFLILAEKMAAGQGKTYMRLDCDVDNAFLNDWYESQGYRVIGEFDEIVYQGRLREKKL